MKKCIKYVLSISLLFLLFSANLNSISAKDEIHSNVEAILVDNSTGEKTVLEIKKTSISLFNTDGSITEGYETTAIMDVNNPLSRDGQGGSKTEAMCTAYLYVTYYLANGGEDIMVSSVSGYWSPDSLISVSNRSTMVTEDAHTLRRYPTSNSFDYGTGWGYVQRYPATSYTGPRTYSEATLTVYDMGGSHNLYLSFNFS